MVSGGLNILSKTRDVFVLAWFDKLTYGSPKNGEETEVIVCMVKFLDFVESEHNCKLLFFPYIVPVSILIKLVIRLFALLPFAKTSAKV